MGKTVSLKDVTIFIISYGELMDQKVNDAMIKELQSLPSESKEGWISVEERLPEYGVKVLVARPNEYSGKTDVLIAQHRKVEPGGTSHGQLGNLKMTYKDYWSLPSIAPFEDITHWQPLPSPPNK